MTRSQGDEDVAASKRRPIAYLLWALMLAGIVAGLLMSVAGGSPAEGDATLAERIGTPIILLAYGTVGLVLVRKVASNRIAWTFLVASALGSIWMAALIYTQMALVEPWPGVEYAYMVNQAVYQPWIMTMVALPLLIFPDGEVPTPRWRWLWWFVIAFAGLTVVGSTLNPVYTDDLAGREVSLIHPEFVAENDEGELEIAVESPFGVDAFGDFMESSGVLILPMLALAFFGPVAAMVYRFRRSSGVERLQLKWVAYSASIAGVGLCLYYLIQAVVSPMPAFADTLVLFALLGVLGIPITAGIAIVRYRLYDIDRLISRTISYGLLVGLLGAVYAGGVFLLGSLPFEGGLPVAASTLAVAALFNPLRRRLQSWIDHRFSRSSYDHQQVIDDFADEVRDQVDVDVLADSLLRTVDDTVVPVDAAIWIRVDDPGD